MPRLFRLLEALFRYGDVHYVRRLSARASSNLRHVLGSLGATWIRVDPWRDFGGVQSGACERLVEGEQPPGFVRAHLIPYHLVLPEVEGRVVVEAGTNEGYGAALLASRAREVHAFDVSAEAIARARERYRRDNLHFCQHDATQTFPLPDGSADVVFSSEVIEHLRDGPAFLEAASRVLRPGGVLYVKTPNDAYNRYENRLNPHHVNPYDADRLSRELEKCFTRVEVSGLTYHTEIETVREDRSARGADVTSPYRFGDPIDIERVLVTRMRIRPQRTASTSGAVAEYLFARAVRPSENDP